MTQMSESFQQSDLFRFFRSFSPASRAAILLSIPYTLIDAAHYFTAGTALIVSVPLLLVIYLLCGSLAAWIALGDGQDLSLLPAIGRSATMRLWLTSTLINSFLSFLLGFTSLGLSVLSGTVFLCLFGPLHLLGSALGGWMGGWFYKQFVQRTMTIAG